MSLPCQLPRYFQLLPLPHGQRQNHFFPKSLLAVSSLLFYSKGLCRHQAHPGSPGQPPGRPQRSSPLQPPHHLTWPLTGSQVWTCVGSVHLLIPERLLVKVHTVALSLEIGIHYFNSIHSNRPALKTVLVEEFTHNTRRQDRTSENHGAKGPWEEAPLPAPEVCPCPQPHLCLWPPAGDSRKQDSRCGQPTACLSSRAQKGDSRTAPWLEAHAPAQYVAPYSAQPHTISNKIMKPGLTFQSEA